MRNKVPRSTGFFQTSAPRGFIRNLPLAFLVTLIRESPAVAATRDAPFLESLSFPMLLLFTAAGLLLALGLACQNLWQRQRTLQKELEQLRGHLQNEQKRLEILTETLPLPFFSKNPQQQYLSCNQTFCDYMGASRDQVIGHNIFDLLPTEQAEIHGAADRQLQAGQEPLCYRSGFNHPQGKREILFSKSGFFDSQGNLQEIFGIMTDVTELNNNRLFLNSIIDAMPSMVIAIDPAEQVSQWNRRAEELSSCAANQAIGRPLAEVFPHYQDLQPLIRQAMLTKLTQGKEKVHWGGNENENFFDILVFPLLSPELEGLVIRADHIDARVKMEEVMIFTEKMMSVGSLAAGMAHEINNPLAVIIQNTQVLLNRFRGDIEKNRKAAGEAGIDMEQIHHYLASRDIPAALDNILDSGNRASRIVNDMVNFAQRRASNYAACDLPQLIQDTLNLAGNDYELKKKYRFREIALNLELAEQLPPLICERDQIQQVLLNLLRNGAQAMHEQPNPTEPPRFKIGARVSGENIQIEVADNGPGLDPNIRKRVFEPFVSTRPVGTGTGLGLSTSYFIVHDKHGGNIQVESIPGQGCRFIIELPIKGLPNVRQ